MLVKSVHAVFLTRKLHFSRLRMRIAWIEIVHFRSTSFSPISNDNLLKGQKQASEYICPFIGSVLCANGKPSILVFNVNADDYLPSKLSRSDFN